MELPKYKNLYISFGCKRDPSKNEQHQQKDLTKRWYVYYDYLLSDGTYKGFKAYGGINRIHTLRERVAEARKFRDGIEELLESGFNPVLRKIDKVEEIVEPGLMIREMPIIDGLKWAKEKHDPLMQPTTRNEYRNILDNIYEGIRRCGYAKLKVGEFKKAHLRQVMDSIQKEKGLSNNRYNSYVIAVKSVYIEFIKYEAFDVSPLANFEMMKEKEAKSFETLTSEERQIVYKHLEKVHPDFLIYFLLIYHTALRPKELVSLQIFNFNEANACFQIDANETVILRNQVHNKTKTQKRRFIPIPPEALQLLKSMKLSQYPKDYFIFSTGFQPGAKNIQRKRATEVWNKEIIQRLKINKKMYSAKHLGIDDKLESKTSLDAIQSQAGHTNKEMTKRYASKLKEVYQKEINEKSKGFLE